MKDSLSTAPRACSVATAAIVSAALLAGAGCATTPPSGPFELWAVGPEGRPVAIAEPVTVVRPGVRIDLRPLSDAERAEWLRRYADLDADPLAGLAGASLLTIRARFSATGELPVHVESQSLRLIPDGKGAGTAPLDYTRAFELLRPDQRELPDKEKIDRFMRGLLDGPVDVAPGRAREGLLVFPEPDPEARLLVLVLPFVQVGSETHRTSLPFRRVYLSEIAAGGPER